MRAIRRRVTATSAAVFLLLWGVIFARMVEGHDPALSRVADRHADASAALAQVTAADAQRRRSEHAAAHRRAELAREARDRREARARRRERAAAARTAAQAATPDTATPAPPTQAAPAPVAPTPAPAASVPAPAPTPAPVTTRRS